MLPMGSQLFCGSAQWPCRCDCDHPALLTEELLLAATIFFISFHLILHSFCHTKQVSSVWSFIWSERARVTEPSLGGSFKLPSAREKCLSATPTLWDLSGLPRYVQGWCLCVVLTVFILATMVRSVFGTMIVQLSSTTNLYWSEITLQIC